MDLTAIPPARRAALELVLDAILDARRIVLTTHVNADGDGTGCEAALAAWLNAAGKHVRIINPTPFPESYLFLVAQQEQILDPGHADAAAEIAGADLVLVLDLSEPKRLGRLSNAIRTRPTAVVDHHLPSDVGVEGVLAQDPTACATGELLYDLLLLAQLPPPWPAAVINGLYAAIVTDTGSFRFSNTTPRAHQIAGDLLRRGVDPEDMYRKIFATVPLRRIQLLRAALDRLDVDEENGLAWITIPREMMREFNATSEDLDGMVEHARSIAGTRVAILLRETADGSTKMSLRSNGDVDVNAIARQFGGGGHMKASGALVSTSLEETREQVLEAARMAVRAVESSAVAE
jgi:phosphoesterase RecJ-like protein